MEPFQHEPLALMFQWIKNRETARINKEANRPKPYTDDVIIQTTRFCNVRRMDDKVSKWLMKHWYLPDQPFKQIIANAGLARLINKIESLDVFEYYGLNKKWNPKKFREHATKIAARGGLFTGAYIINGIAGQSKITTVENQVQAMYALGEKLVNYNKMEDTHILLQTVKGNGSFIAGQLVADLRHVITDAPWSDKNTWAPLGPGSRRGIAWLTGWDGKEDLKKLPQKEFEAYLQALVAAMKTDPEVWRIVRDRKLEMHDVQNCLCETDKYLRLTNGTGRGKNKFAGV